MGRSEDLLMIDYTGLMAPARPGIWMAFVACLFAADVRAQTVSMEIQDGAVLLIARDVPLQKILYEWAKVGGVDVIVRGEGLPSAPLTLLLRDVTEREAATILLREVGGYLLVAREAGTSGASTFGRIIIVPGKGPALQNAGDQAHITSGRPPAGILAEDAESLSAITRNAEAA